MRRKTDIYWPVFFVVAVVTTVATWRFAPNVPLSSDARAQCILLTHRARQFLRLEPSPSATSQSTVTLQGEAKPKDRLQSLAIDDTTDATGDVADKKAKYDDITRRMQERRRAILEQNLSKSKEGQDALAALKAFKEFSAKVDALKKEHGETDYRVTSLRGDLVRLKDEVRRTNDLYKQWKASHPEEVLIPEDDPLYRKLTAERALLSIDD